MKKYDVDPALGKSREPATEGIQRVIDQCGREGGGIVVIPEGEYQVASLMLYSDITLYLERNARLIGSRDWRDYTDFHVPSTIEYLHSEKVVREWNLPPHYFNAMITAVGARNLSVIGEEGSEINGSDCFDPNGEEKFRGPMGMVLSGCRNVTLEGYTFADAANWSHQLDSCVNVDIRNVTVLAGHDGFNLHHCENVRIEDCVIRTGDDCIAGYDARNVCVRGCRMNTSCNGFRFGGVNLYVENCTLEGPGQYPHRVSGRHNTLYAFEYYSLREDRIREPAGNWKIIHCRFCGVDGFLHYVYGDEKEHQTNQPLESLQIEDCEISGLQKPSECRGTKEAPCFLSLKDLHVSFREGVQEPVFLETGPYDTVREEGVVMAEP